MLRGANLAEVAHLQTNRTVVAIRDPADRPLGALTDDVVSAFDGDEVGWRFREIEVEAAAGAPANVIDSGGRRAAGGRRGRARQRAQAGPRPRTSRAGARRSRRPPGGKDATTRAAFQAAVASSVRRLLLHDPVIRLDAGEEGVHQARVATRRLRSDLRTFRPLLDEEALAPLIEELRWLGGLLGAVRDADVLRQRLGEAVDGLEEESDRESGRLLLDRVETDRKPHLAALHEALDSRRYLDLTQALVDLAVTPPRLDRADEPARRPTRSWPARPWQHLRKRVGELGKHPATRSCTASASWPSGPATRPRPRPPSSRPPSATPTPSPVCRACSATTRTPSSPSSGCGT